MNNMFPDAELCFVQHSVAAKQHYCKRYIHHRSRFSRSRNDTLYLYTITVFARKNIAGALRSNLKNVGFIPAYLGCICDEQNANVSSKSHTKWELISIKGNIRWPREELGNITTLFRNSEERHTRIDLTASPTAATSEVTATRNQRWPTFF